MGREMSYRERQMVAGLNALTDQLQARLVSGQPLFRTPTPQERRRIDEHNARVLAARKRVADANQAAANRAEIAAVRKRLCGSCFCELPASGVCGTCC
ncbi:hypothetical protein [Verrucosispora sp. WMMD1129]|uniref:hypothetical protein n=1 Tax=Verrucosispora sp. WMMD1129 TaxID=3016093 RepID=UPI00249AED72|nr:hypothetical protein [Verrucosispora sp. WMMD1129]WFE47612.1 hypothetical protein O7624_26465 [Verrucosispora sp. WMMD1129]